MAVAQDSHYLRLQTMNAGLDGRPPSALARGVQITEFKETRVNPEPIVLEDSDLLLEQYLSPGKLRLLTGVQDLESVRCLEIKVDTTDTSLGNFGSLLPNLTQLKLSNSLIRGIRDLGSSLRNLTILWMSRCGLQELDGISSMLSLHELYLSYNEICDISNLSMLDFLEILDLEGNNIDDEQQIHHLSMCARLSSLTLEGNPVCVLPRPDADEMEDYDYRLTVKQAIPQLKYLDEEPLTEEASPSKKVNVFDEDWAYLEELQRDVGIGGSMESLESSQESGSRPGSTGRPGTASLRPSTGYRPGSVLRPGTGFRPMSSRIRPATTSGGSMRPATAAARPGTSQQQPNAEAAAMTDDGSSELTMGKVICGNPSKALIARRKLGPEQEQKEATELKLFPQYQHKPEHTFDPVPSDERERSEIIDELREWKKDHEKRMEKLKEERAPQVLVIDHDDAVSISSEEEITDDEEEDFEQDFSPLEKSQEDELISDTVLGSEIRNRRKEVPSSSDIYEGLNLTKIHRGLKHDEAFDVDRDFLEARLSPNSPKPVELDLKAPLKPLSPIKPSGRLSPSYSRDITIPRAPPPSAVVRNPLSRSMVPDTKTGLPLPDRSHALLRQSIATDKPLPPPNRPSTASAVLSRVPQPKIRRQLPQVPSLPSKLNFPK